MKVKGFNNREYNLNLENKKGKEKSSSYHNEVRKILKEIFPLETIIEELRLPGTKENFSKDLYADFFIPRLKIVIEIHGEQHYTFIPFFHKDLQGFVNSKKRDRRKKDWAELNSLTFVELSYKEDKDEWKRKIIYAAET